MNETNQPGQQYTQSSYRNPIQPTQTFPPSSPPPYEKSVPPFTPSPTPQKASTLPSKLLIIVALLIIIAGGAVAFAYFQQIGPFSVGGVSSESTFISDILLKTSQIKSSSYAVSGSLNVGKREEGALPFVLKVSNAAEMRQLYQDEATRAKDITNLLSILKRYEKYDYAKKTYSQIYPYPKTLKDLVTDAAKRKFYPLNPSITDPATDKEYSYQVTDNGKNFLLEVTFETDRVPNSIEKSNIGVTNGTTAIVNGKKVGFTKNSSTYFYVPSEPPVPFLVGWSEALRYLPADVSGSITSTASSEWKEGTLADWAFNFDASGSFGDLTYKINADALKKSGDYYFKINNIPSLFLGTLSAYKGKWIKIASSPGGPSKPSGLYGRGGLNYFAAELPKIEKSYKENRVKFSNLLKRAASIADEVKLISFKEKPRQETLDGRKLIRYELSINKSAILAFYSKLSEEASKEAGLRDNFTFLNDQGLVDYLKSAEFDQVFDYFDKNTKFVLWTDTNGFPAIVQETMRLVPPDTAVQLKDKQVNVMFKLILSKINESVKIEVPPNATPIEKVSEEMDKNSFNPRGSISETKSSLSSIRTAAEIVYDKTNSSYGTKAFALGPCKQTAGTLFANNEVYQGIVKATGGNATNATCISKGSSNKVTSYAVSAPIVGDTKYSWCVDSMGNSKQIVGSIKTDQCK